MKQKVLLIAIILTTFVHGLFAQQRRPIDNEHPLWLIHVDVWYKADPQKIIDLIPDDIKPYVCLNLSLSCQYDKTQNVYKMPQQAVRTYKSWATVCQQNGMWFTCQPASGGHTHIQDNDLETFEYFFKQYPNFLGWNYAEQFWGFDEGGDLSSSPQGTRLALFAQLVEMSHKYGGFLTVSFCGNIWSHALNPVGMMKREPKLLEASEKYPEAILWLYKYTTSSCFYNNESVSFSPYISGLAKNYGVRYDNCGWTSALDAVLGKNHGKTYPASAGIGTVLEQTGINGGAVWDGPELTWREECFHEVNTTDVDGYKRRSWKRFPNFEGVWTDMFRKVIDGTVHIPTREEVIARTKIVVVNDISSGNDEQKYAAWGDLYDGIYKQDDPFNMGNGQWMDNLCYFKKTGRYATIPVCIGLYDDLAKSIPVQVKKSEYASRWSTQDKKVEEFNEQYPETSKGDLFVARSGNQLVAYTPYTYLNEKTTAKAAIQLQYNTCDMLQLNLNKLSGGIVREYSDHIIMYLNNFRTDTTFVRDDIITITGATAKPTFTLNKRNNANCTTTETLDNGTYTLTVTHMGPVDINIQCSGNNTRTNTAAAIKALPLPKQPEEYHGAITIEAEDMDYKNIKSCCTNPYNSYPSIIGHAGNGLVDFGNKTTGSLRHQLTLKSAGDYRIAIRYMNTTKAGNLTVSLNGTNYTAPVEKTDKNEWKKAIINAPLIAGTNDLRINNTEGIAMYVDQIVYTPADIEDEIYNVVTRETESGSIATDKTTAAEGETVKLTIETKEGWQLTDILVVNSVYYTQGKKIEISEGATEVTFTMPDDNITLLPVFKETSAIAKTDYNNVTSGALPEGWRCTQESNEVHEYPNTYDRGARMMSGFTGYQGKGLYWREVSAEYGRQEQYPLTLGAGEYKLTFAMAAWKGTPEFKVEILDVESGTSIASSEVYTATPNAEGNTSADISSAVLHELTFTVDTKSNFVIRFSNESTSSGLHEFLLLSCKMNLIEAHEEPIPTPTSEIIDFLGGIKVWSYDKTIYIQSQPDQDYRIIDVSGRLLKQGITQRDREEVVLDSQSSGIAIVLISGRSFKVKY
ncbi:MAG: glycosyl hydrolase family 98 [Bacteroidales bacterium]|nr:glycosyl hydrolase family 98 [Bacteroidales bacterium]